MIEGCATKEDLANPAEFDSEGQRCLIVGKDGNATPAWCQSLSTKSASSPSSSASTTRASSMPKPSPPRETRAPSSGTRRTAKLASLANSTLEITKAARPATMLLIAPLADTSWTRSGRSSSTPTSTAPAGQLENNTVGFLLSISTTRSAFSALGYLSVSFWCRQVL